ncbi:MAG: DNA-binding response regulator [Phototrophicales bacterium]|nr:MAG: DNA-binding response regulator [Phototrophicales bacterium]
MSEPKIRIIIVDDHDMVRQGLEIFLRAFDDFELVGQATNGLEALELCQELQPDVVLMDMIMPEMDGVTAIREICSQYPNIKIIALTSFTDDSSLVQNALRAGAAGYLFKDVSVDDLAAAIRTAASGQPVLAPEAARMLIQATTQPTLESFHLTDRELEVLALMVEGMSNRQIAHQLSISYSTVRFHVSSILSKLNVESRTEAVTVALRNNLLS